MEDAKLYGHNKVGQNLTIENKPTEMENLKRQIKVLEERLKKQRQSIPEKPYSEMSETKSRSKVYLIYIEINTYFNLIIHLN